MKTYQEINSAETMDAIIHYAETLFGIRFTKVKRNRYNGLCPFHSDSKNSFMVYVNKDDEVRFHCFGACKGDWDIYDLIMLRKKYRFRAAQKEWADHLGVQNYKPYNGSRSSCIPEPDETPAPDDTAVFVEPDRLDATIVGVLRDAGDFYHDLLMSNENRFKFILDYLARRGVGKETLRKFNIGYAPPYSDEQYQGRALIDAFLPRFKTDHDAFNVFMDAGLVRLLNDKSDIGYGYYCRQIDFKRKDSFSRNYSDFFAGRIVFPIYEVDTGSTGPSAFIGRRPDDRGVRWLKYQNPEVPLSKMSRLYGLEKAAPYIRQYKTILLVEGLFDYFAFYHLLHGQGKAVVVSTLGSYVTPEAAAILNGLDIEHFIVAYNWDVLGRNGIERMVSKSGGWLYYLGGLAKDQDPYDMLKPVVDTISGFTLHTGEERN